MKPLKLLLITKDFSKHVEKSSFYLQQELSKLTQLMVWSDHGDIRDILRRLKETPDFILLNDFKPDYTPFIRNLRLSPVPCGAIVHDLHYKIPQRKRFYVQEKIHYLFSIYRDAFYRYYPEFRERMIWLPHHVPTTIFKDYGSEKDIDWLMSGALYPHIYPLRHCMYERLKNHSGFVYVKHPGYKNVDEQTPGVFVGKTYAMLLNRAKIFLTCDSVEKLPVLKYFESLACGALLLASESLELFDLGFIDGETFIAVNQDNFMERAEYYLKCEEEREAIARRGMEMVRRRHSTAQRAKELVRHIRNIVTREKKM